MATLLGQKINATYDSLLKTEDNDGITGSLKQITDGVGQTTPLYLSTTEAKIGGNLEITGDLTVGGTTTYVNTDNVTVKDGLVLLANDNVADIIDIGLYGKYNDGTVKYTGLYRDATDGVFKIFDGLATEPTTTVGGGNLADFAAAGGSFSGNLTLTTNYYSTDGAISLTNGDIVTGGHIAINSGNTATSFSSNANQLIVGGADSGTNQGMTIASDSGATGNIFFADGITGDQQYRGSIIYNHSSDTMYLGASAANRLSITSSGLSVLTGGKIFVNGAGNNGYINSKGAVAAQVLSVDNSRLFRGIDSSVQEVFYVQGTGDVFASGQLSIDSIVASGSVSAFSVTASNAITSGTLNVSDAIIHTGDTDTMIEFLSNQIKTTTGGVLNINTTPTKTTFYQDVGIGVSPSAKFHTQVSSETTIAIFENTTGKSFNILTDINKVYLSEGTSSTNNSFIINGTNNQLEFRTNGSEAMRIDSSGNVGIGVTPSSLWSTSYDALQIGLGGSIYAHNAAGNALKLGSNIVYEGLSPNFYDKYLATSTATKYEQDSGSHIWSVAPSGTAGTAITWSESMRIDSSGNVGIGTSNPADKLELKDGNIRVTTSSSFSNFISGRASVPSSSGFNLGGLAFDAYSTGTTYVTGAQIESFSEGAWTSTSAPSYLSFQTVSSGSTSLSERMRIDSSGKVTITNTTDNVAELKVLRSAASSSTYASVGTVGGTALFKGTGDTRLEAEGSSIITFKTNSTERMRIDSSGRVGIGTQNPSQGNLVISPTVSSANLDGLVLAYNPDGASNRVRAQLHIDNFNGVLDLKNSSDVITTKINSSGDSYFNGGNVGIGTTSPSAKLDISGILQLGEGSSTPSGAGVAYGLFHYSGVGLGLYSAASGSTQGIGFWLNNGSAYEAGRWLSNGNLGIGTTSPSYKLDVAGTMRTTANSVSLIRLETTNSSTYRAEFQARYSYAEPFWISAYNGNKVIATRTGSSYLDLYANGSTQATLTATGFAIGHTSPSYKLQVESGTSASGFRLNSSSTSYTGMFISNTSTGAAKIYMDASNGDFSGSDYFNIGQENDLSFHIHGGTAASYIKFSVLATEKFRMATNGDFHADGDVIAYSTTISDKRLKDDVQTIDGALDKVKSLRGVSYVWNNGSRKGQKDLGLIAQEVEEVLPEIVREKEMALVDGETYKTVDYEKIVGVLINAVKELNEKVESLEKQLKSK